MKYLEEDELEVGAYYHCVTYDDDDVVVEYYGDGFFGVDLDFGWIRYVLCKVEDLREKRKAFE